MKRLHVNLAVTDLDASVRFYASLFDAQPTVLKDDYAKWMVEHPRVNFAITTRGSRKGIDHLGIQVETEAELGEIHARLVASGAPVLEQGETTCCYARSEKNWIFDPEGTRWETFLTKGESAVYGGAEARPAEDDSVCCTRPEISQEPAGGACCDGARPEAVSERAGCCA